MIKLSTLHNQDAIYFPIVVDGRHGIARYPITHNADGLIVINHTLLELYYLNGVNAELNIFQYIIDKLEKIPTLNHPNINQISDVKLIPINIKKIAKKKIITIGHLSYRVSDGNLIAYYSAPFRMLVADNTVDKPTPVNIKCNDGLEERFRFITNFIVNCYL